MGNEMIEEIMASEISEASAAWIATETDESALLSGLRDCLSLTVENIRNAAMIVRRFEELRLNRAKLESAVPPIILRSLRNIAYGRMLPETFMLLNGTVQDRVGRLPIDEQRQLVSGGKQVVVVTDEGTIEVPVDVLTAKQAILLFDGDRMRTEQQQLSYLDRRKRAAAEIVKPRFHAPVHTPKLSGEDDVDWDELDELEDGEDDLPEDFAARLAEVRAEKMAACSTGTLGHAVVDEKSMTIESAVAFHSSRITLMLTNNREKITTEIVETLRDLISEATSIVKASGRRL